MYVHDVEKHVKVDYSYNSECGALLVIYEAPTLLESDVLTFGTQGHGDMRGRRQNTYGTRHVACPNFFLFFLKGTQLGTLGGHGNEAGDTARGHDRGVFCNFENLRGLFCNFENFKNLP